MGVVSLTHKMLLKDWPKAVPRIFWFRKEIVVKCCKHLLHLHFNPYIIVCSSNKLIFFGKNTNLLNFQMFLDYPWNINSNLLLQTSYDMYLAEQLHGTWYVYFCLESRGKIWGYFCEFGVMKPSGLARTCHKHECPGVPSYCAPRSAKTYWLLF